MIEFKTGDLLITRDGTECVYIEHFKKAFSSYHGSINPSTYFGYKCSTYKELDIVKHERDGIVLYKEFKYKVPNQYTPIDTRVLVWDGKRSFEEVKKDTGFLFKRYFQGIDNDKFCTFIDGKTSFSDLYGFGNKTYWDNAVIYEDGMLD